MANIYVGNTDNDWFDFLASLSGIDEVNFWKPSAGNFKAIGEGERFAFRLKSPRNKIGGFGTFVKSSSLPIQTAWEAFGVKNGVSSLAGLVATIARYRRDEIVTPSTFIVCRVLVQPVFLPPHLWFDVPDSWSGSIMQGKTYPGDSEEGISLWRNLEDRAGSVAAPVFGFSEPRYGEPVLVVPRLGQGAFRVAITDLYQRQCALTGGKVLPALDAAHIRPYAEGGTHTKSNGILLRKDIHSVFDAGYATIDTDCRFVVSDKVRDVFNNGEEYRRLHGTSVRVPSNPVERPDRSALQWHNENRFLG
jgi:putative restriction endonuclease